jgi:hypothetical protein
MQKTELDAAIEGASMALGVARGLDDFLYRYGKSPLPNSESTERLAQAIRDAHARRAAALRGE